MLKVTKYDRMAGMLVSALILLASSVLVMLLLFVVGDPAINQHQQSVEYVGSGAGSNTPNAELDLEVPRVDEASELIDVAAVVPLSHLLAITSTVAASVEFLNFNDSRKHATTKNRPLGPRRMAPPAMDPPVCLAGNGGKFATKPRASGRTFVSWMTSKLSWVRWVGSCKLSMPKTLEPFPAKFGTDGAKTKSDSI